MWTERTLSWQEMRLRHLPAEETATTDWRTFRVRELAGIAFLLMNVLGSQETASSVRTRQPSVPDSSRFQIAAHFEPYERVGGDWYQVEEQGDTLWVLVADVAGKGRGANLIAEGLPWLWQSSAMVRARASGASPGALLNLLARELSEALPFGLFVEAILARFSPETVSLAIAGACPGTQRRAKQDQVELHTLGGPWLGVPIEQPYGEQCWPFVAGDEWALASDGLFDQPVENTGEERVKAWLLRRKVPSGQSLHQFLTHLVQTAARQHGQHDDITIVTVGQPQAQHGGKK